MKHNLKCQTVLSHMANIFSTRTDWPSVLPCHLELHTMSNVSDVAGCEGPLSLFSSLSVSLKSSFDAQDIR